MALLTVHNPVFSMILSRFDLNSLKIVQKQDNSRKTVLIRGAIFQSCLGEIRKKVKCFWLVHDAKEMLKGIPFEVGLTGILVDNVKWWSP